MSLITPVQLPPAINGNLTTPSCKFLEALLGRPRMTFTTNCQPVTNKFLASMMASDSVGPFKATGLRPAVASLKLIMVEIAKEHPDVYEAIGTAGMLCSRYQRGSTAISSHSWGTAIDLTLCGKTDDRGDGKTQYGLTLIAPIFNRHGWIWGASFRTEDAMHFEVSQQTLQKWKADGVLGTSARQVEVQPLSKTKHSACDTVTLRRGDRGPLVLMLQRRLNIHNGKLLFDGIYGPRTEQAVMAFQRGNSLVADGVAGPRTIRAIGGLT